MATEKQYEFFKLLYDEEDLRGNKLQEHAKNNLALATFYSAFIFFVLEKFPPSSALSKAIFLATVVCMLLAFLLSLWATRISIYESINEPADIIGAFGDVLPDDEEFFDDRIVDFTVAYEKNSLVNDAKANQLLFARYFLLLGIVMHGCYFAIKLL